MGGPKVSSFVSVPVHSRSKVRLYNILPITVRSANNIQTNLLSKSIAQNGQLYYNYYSIFCLRLLCGNGVMHVTSHTRPSCLSACNIERMGVAWGNRGGKGWENIGMTFVLDFSFQSSLPLFVCFLVLPSLLPCSIYC